VHVCEHVDRYLPPTGPAIADACDALTRFVNKVQARSGKSIPSGRAVHADPAPTAPDPARPAPIAPGKPARRPGSFSQIVKLTYQVQATDETAG